jgi:hypothetical protein
MITPRTIECALPTGQRQSRRPARQTRVAIARGRVPRVSRLLALALRLDRLVRTGAIADYATLARLGHVSRARVTQILSLLLLAPDIQETLLFLPPTERGRDALRLRQLQALAALPDWRDQRGLWHSQTKTSRTFSSGGEAVAAQDCLKWILDIYGRKCGRGASRSAPTMRTATTDGWTQVLQ